MCEENLDRGVLSAKLVSEGPSQEVTLSRDLTLYNSPRENIPGRKWRVQWPQDVKDT